MRLRRPLVADEGLSGCLVAKQGNSPVDEHSSSAITAHADDVVIKDLQWNKETRAAGVSH